MNQHEVMLAAIGDLEVTRRALIMEIQARDAYIKELEGRLGIEHPDPEANGNGILVPDKEIVIP
jgi:hypothetical protein